MPRTVHDILAHAGELAQRAEASLVTAVADARAHGYSWAPIGSLLGTSGEAAHQRCGSSRRA